MNNWKRSFLIFIGLACITVFLIGCGPEPPIIIKQPMTVITNCGRNASYTVEATGTAPLYYQWMWNGVNLVDGAGGGRVRGATSPMLTITDLLSEDTGNISARVSNSAGTVYSNIVALYVRDTLDFMISWPNGDLDIGVKEPDGEVFYSSDYWYSDNGAFSADYVNGGTEWWVMYDSHDTGDYYLKIWDWDYEGDVEVVVYHNEWEDTSLSDTYYVEPGFIYYFDPVTVIREHHKNILKFNVTKEPIPQGAIKQMKGPSLRAFGS